MGTIKNLYVGIGKSGKDVHQNIQSELSLIHGHSHGVNSFFAYPHSLIVFL